MYGIRFAGRDCFRFASTGCRALLWLPALLVLHLPSPTAGAAPAGSDPGSFQLTSGLVSYPESSLTATAVVVRTGAANGTASVDLITRDDTAHDGTDYSRVHLTLVFTNGETRKDVAIPLLDDNVVEPIEQFFADLTNATTGATISVPTATFTISDNDSAGVMQFSAARFFANETGGHAEVRVTRTGSTAEGATVDYATADFTAKAGLDYVATNGTLRFGSNETERIISLPLINDAQSEGSEEFDVILSRPGISGTLGATWKAAVEIGDDEPFPVTCTRAGMTSAVAAGGEHHLDCDAFITLTNTLIVTRDLTLDAAGHNVTLSARDTLRLIEVRPGAHLTLRHINLTQGRGTQAGAILNEGGLELIECQVNSNRAVGLPGIRGPNGTSQPPNVNLPGTPGGPGAPGEVARGGAIVNLGELSATNCTFHGNTVEGGAGGNGGDGGNGARFTDMFGRCRFGTPGANGGDGGNGSLGLGGALYNTGFAVLVHATFQNNAARGGLGGSGGLGGITPCAFGVEAPTGRSAPGGLGAGGACYNTGSLFIAQSVGFQNLAFGGSGANGRPEPEESSVRIQSVGAGGTGGFGFGGAFCNLASLRLVNSTLSANSVQGGASGLGGVYNIVGCPAFVGYGGDAFGGAIFSSGQFASTNNTIWSNQALPGLAFNRTNQPACIGIIRPGTNGNAYGDCLVNSNLCSLINTLVGGLNSSNNVVGGVGDLGHNLCSDNSAAFTSSTSSNQTDPLLGPFGDYGGHTLTFPLQASSPALNHGDDGACPPTDQRGVLRPHDSQCDIGAVEQCFLSLLRLPNGLLQPRYGAPPGTRCLLESSEDLQQWRVLQQTEAGATGVVSYQPIDPKAPPNQSLRIRMP